MTPSDWSSGVVGAFAVTSRPPVASTASVKVPPTSTPSSTRSAAAAQAREEHVGQVLALGALHDRRGDRREAGPRGDRPRGGVVRCRCAAPGARARACRTPSRRAAPRRAPRRRGRAPARRASSRRPRGELPVDRVQPDRAEQPRRRPRRRSQRGARAGRQPVRDAREVGARVRLAVRARDERPARDLRVLAGLDERGARRRTRTRAARRRRRSAGGRAARAGHRPI